MDEEYWMTSPRLRICSRRSFGDNLEEDNVNAEEVDVNLKDDSANSEDDNVNSEDDNGNSEEDSVNSEDGVYSEEDNVGSETSGEGMPRSMGELGVLLGYIKRNPEEFDLRDIKVLKELFLSWRDDSEDISEERFKMYGHFMAARDAIRGSSDTEDDDHEFLRTYCVHELGKT